MFSALSLLVDDAEPVQGLLGVVSGNAARRGRIVEAVVDSGAVHSAAPPQGFPGPVSYHHLTLPTILRVWVSGGCTSHKQKQAA